MISALGAFALCIPDPGNRLPEEAAVASDFHSDPNDYYPGSQVDFYQIKMDSWITLANSSFPVYDQQMVMYENQPTIIGGEYETFLREIEVDWYHKRDHVQIYEESENRDFMGGTLPHGATGRSDIHAL